MAAERKLRVFLLGNPVKPGVDDLMRSIADAVRDNVDVVGCGHTTDLAAVARAEPEMLVVLGGDGTMLGVARWLADAQIPIVGVNLGKLGFLADFSVEDVKQYLQSLGPNVPEYSERMFLAVRIRRAGGSAQSGLAVNDCVVQAGPPYRLITLALSLNGEQITEVVGDGLILATPSGSTAHNMSAGGPILMPGVRGIAVTPLCPHSLTHRPLVVEALNSVIQVTAVRVNPGTTVSLDGQVSMPLCEGDQLTVQRYSRMFRLVKRPGHEMWNSLVYKLGWGTSPHTG
jgi:NAD+ kinase